MKDFRGSNLCATTRNLSLRRVLAICAAVTVWQTCANRTQAADSLMADLAFRFVCEGTSYPVRDETVEIFLADQGFRVLNKVKVQIEHNVTPVFDLSIVGIDSRRRAIHLTAFPHRRGVYWLRLQTPPPTRRSSELEAEILSFVTESLKCGVDQVTRGENGEDARELYDEVFKLYEGWFRQADELKRRPI